MHRHISRTTLTTLSSRGDADRVTVVEALGRSYYDEGHIPGALNLPHDSTDATIAAVLPDRSRTVVVYCSNLACQNSTILSRRLDQLGYSDVREYDAGKQDWIEAGLPIESASSSAPNAAAVR